MEKNMEHEMGLYIVLRRDICWWRRLHTYLRLARNEAIDLYGSSLHIKPEQCGDVHLVFRSFVLRQREISIGTYKSEGFSGIM